MSRKTESELVNEQVEKAMDAGVEGQNAMVKTRLRQAREKATAELNKPLFGRVMTLLRQPSVAWPSAGGLALMMVWLAAVQPVEQQAQFPTAGVEAILDQEEMDLFEDYEFYFWLAQDQWQEG